MTIEIPGHMQAMRLHHTGRLSEWPEPLSCDTVPVPEPADGQCLVRVSACGVCHTELDIIEARTAPASLPLTPGHQATGQVIAISGSPGPVKTGQLVGIAWIWSACGTCRFCDQGRENLCSDFVATGRDRHGGYAEYLTVPTAFLHPLPPGLDPVLAAPLLCAGAVGFRALRLCDISDGDSLGLTGFGASGHLVIQMARALYPRSRIAVFARNAKERQLAMALGAHWAGDTLDNAPFLLDAIIDTTPAWLPVSAAMRQLAPGGRLVINAIRKLDEDRQVLAELDYATQLWREKSISTVANVSREDVRGCLELAASADIRPQVTRWPLKRANQALHAIRTGGTTGAQVLVVRGD